MSTQSEAEVAAHEGCTLLSFKVVPLVPPVCWLPCSGIGLPSEVFDTEILGDGTLSLVSRFPIIRDTVPTSTLTSLLTSEPPVSVAELLRENSFSFQPFVLFVMDSLYL